ncbi:hypothetical protein DSM112329_02924 [Paraconexibacter sp. AEG42_29]|uniref:Uncharacterized protein n=1 Tax=Paraconexibacter sp. AEG42_29 TaxID=2997339 RepID=A0AAU7AWM3_9ACTN
MKKDPFDRLEAQLRGTIDGRRDRRRWLRRRGGLALVLAAVVGGGGLATASVLRGDSQSDVERAIQAGQEATVDAAACKVTGLGRPRGSAIATKPGSADPRIAARYRIFRRATRPAERRVDLRFAAFGGAVLRNTVRIAVAHNGARFELAITEGRPRLGRIDGVACGQAASRAAVASVPAANTRLRERVARIMNGRVAATRRASAPTAQQLSLASHSRFNRSGSAGTGSITNGRLPAIGGYRTDADGPSRFKVLFGLVPDEVRSVQLVDQAGPAGERAATVTVPVRDNVYDIRAPRRMGPTMLLRWRTADGHTVRVLHPRF